MSAGPEGQYFYTAILQKAAPIQNWSGQRESNPHHQPRRLMLYPDELMAVLVALAGLEPATWRL
ncbi:TPA: hypothetical protein JL075_003524 [Escherichia coli]|nr:hypothetical protein [Escherichia coli]HAW0343589.1 hypothetical protein [Escherichia coli]HAW5055568.1 hypothetical protein [Escherichia coli]HAW5375914.1 hypothetical protein [Escherichia coli]HAW6373309.1 hypothetical protein [Escherichia coli]